MLFEINLLAGNMLILQHKMIEIVKAAPRFVSEYLQIEYEQRTREKWSECIFRQVTPTKNYALLPDEEDQDIGETHKSLAKLKRKAQNELLAEESKKSLGTIFTNQSNANQLRVQAMGLAEKHATVHPIIFEECYCMATAPKFVEMVKRSAELTEAKILESQSTVSKSLPATFAGVHLFVMAHGFQGNHGDMRLFKNQISLQHPEAVILLSQANEDQTEGDIMEMGERLATEVK